MKAEIRIATEEDVPRIREIFEATYTGEYPYPQFLDENWLKRSVFADNILMLAASLGGHVVGTASVVFDIGAHSDHIGEFGRLAVDPEARGHGLGNAMMAARIEHVQERLLVGIVRNRTVHPFSQMVSRAHGFQPVGFLPLRFVMKERESVALWANHFGPAMDLRKNHPRLIPEAVPLADLILGNCGLRPDAIADDDAAPYPWDEDFLLRDLTSEGLPGLLRIERGRVRNREVFGPARLHYGFFLLSAKKAHYVIARRPRADGTPGLLAGALGFVRDDHEKAVRVFELVSLDDRVVRFLIQGLLIRCLDWGIPYIEVEVSAHAPRMQRTLLELGFLPAGYVPVLVFDQVERIDIVKMVRLLIPARCPDLELIEETRAVADLVLAGFTRQAVLPAVAAAVDRLALFAGLNPEQTDYVAGFCQLDSLATDDVLFSQGEEPTGMSLILEGRFDVVIDERAVGVCRRGDSTGEVALLSESLHSATVVATAPSQVARISRSDLQTMIRRRPDVGVILFRNLGRGLGEKLRRADSKLIVESL